MFISLNLQLVPEPHVFITLNMPCVLFKRASAGVIWKIWRAAISNRIKQKNNRNIFYDPLILAMQYITQLGISIVILSSCCMLFSYNRKLYFFASYHGDHHSDMKSDYSLTIHVVGWWWLMMVNDRSWWLTIPQFPMIPIIEPHQWSLFCATGNLSGPLKKKKTQVFVKPCSNEISQQCVDFKEQQLMFHATESARVTIDSNLVFQGKN